MEDGPAYEERAGGKGGCELISCGGQTVLPASINGHDKGEQHDPLRVPLDGGSQRAYEFNTERSIVGGTRLARPKRNDGGGRGCLSALQWIIIAAARIFSA